MASPARRRGRVAFELCRQGVELIECGGGATLLAGPDVVGAIEGGLHAAGAFRLNPFGARQLITYASATAELAGQLIRVCSWRSALGPDQGCGVDFVLCQVPCSVSA